MKGTSTALRYSRKADLEAEVHWRPTSCSVNPETSHSASSTAARSKPVCGASAKCVARVRPIARARQARQAPSVAVVTAASVNRRLLTRVIGDSLAEEAQTRVLTIACCEPQTIATALSATRAGSRPVLQSSFSPSPGAILLAFCCVPRTRVKNADLLNLNGIGTPPPPPPPARQLSLSYLTSTRDDISLLFSSPQGPRSTGQRHATSAAAELPGEGGGQARATACAIYPGSAGGGRAWRQSVLPW